MESRICLIRHGITEGNKQRLYYGHTDIPLADEGIEELKALTEVGTYPDSGSAAFYTTGMIRTEQTLEIIYGKREHEALDQLREINFGDFEMRSHGKLKELEEYQIWIADKRGELAPPNGESINIFHSRISSGFEELKNRHLQRVLSLRHREENALSVAVCHGGTISAVLQDVYPDREKNFYAWIPKPGHGYILYMEDGSIVDTEKF